MNLKTYVCHKRVRAAKIQDIQYGTTSAVLLLEIPGQTEPARKPVAAEWMSKHRPSREGYFVQYLDGDTGEVSYESYSPAKAFEEGYTEAKDFEGVWQAQGQRASAPSSFPARDDTSRRPDPAHGAPKPAGHNPVG